MVIRIEPTNGAAVEREVSSKRLAAAFRHGHTDWVVPSDRDINASRDGDLGLGPLGAFARTDDGTTLTVTFDTGEAFVGGAYLASDDATAAEHSVTLADNTADQTVYLGWDLSAADTLIIGLAADFATHDPRVAIYEFDTSGGAVSASEDLRPLSPSDDPAGAIASVVDTDGTTPLSLDTGVISNPAPRYRITVAREAQANGESYQNLRLNGISSGDYHYDYYDAYNNTFTSHDNQTSFGKLAGVSRDGATSHGAVAQQTIVVDCPFEVGSVTRRYPTCSMGSLGLFKNADHLHEGSLAVDVAEVNRIRLFGGVNATGKVVVRAERPFP